MKTVKKIYQCKTKDIDPVFNYLFDMKNIVNTKSKAIKMEDFFNLDLVNQALKVNICHKINTLMTAREQSKATKIDFINSIQAQNQNTNNR